MLSIDSETPTISLSLCLRFITGDSYSTHHCISYEKVAWASLTVSRDSHWFLFIYKALAGNLPSYITLLLCGPIVKSLAIARNVARPLVLQRSETYKDLYKSANVVKRQA